MKIGIYLSEILKYPTMGGGFSYNETLVLALDKLKTHHEFVFLSAQSKEKSQLVLNHPILYFPIKDAFPVKFNLLDKAMNQIARISLMFKSLQEVYVNKIYENTQKINRENFENLVSKEEIDLVYYLQPMLCISPEVPYFTTFWDLGHLSISYFPEVANQGEFEVREKWYSYYLKRASRIIAESEEGKKILHTYYNIPLEKIRIVHQFPSSVIDCKVDEINQKAFLEKNNLSPKEFLFYPAQFWGHKNHYNLLKALAFLKEKYNQSIALVLTGADKGNLAYIKNKIEEFGLKNEVFYLGFVEKEELYTLYKNALALLMPTFLGPTNLPIIEALHLACPVICSDFEGHREMAGDAALYFNPADFEDIVDKIWQLKHKPQVKNSLIQKGQDTLKSSSFSIEAALLSIIGAFDEFEKIRNCWKT